MVGAQGQAKWAKAKIQPIAKSKKFSKRFIELFVNFSIFGHFSEFFFINGITFLFSLLLLQIW